MNSSAKASSVDRYRLCGVHVKTISAVVAISAIGYAVLWTVVMYRSLRAEMGAVFVAHVAVLGAVLTREPRLLYIYFVTQGLYMVGCLSCLLDSDWPIYAINLVFASCCLLLNVRVMEALKVEARSSHKADEAQEEGLANSPP